MGIFGWIQRRVRDAVLTGAHEALERLQRATEPEDVPASAGELPALAGPEAAADNGAPRLAKAKA